MLYHFLTTILPVVGILLCPFACIGTGVVTEHSPMVSGNSCCGTVATHQVQTQPSEENRPDFPDHDDHDHGHECVSKARINTSTRTLLLKLDASFLTDTGLIIDHISVAFRSADAGPPDRNATHPDLQSGMAVRISFASLLV